MSLSGLGFSGLNKGSQINQRIIRLHDDITLVSAFSESNQMLNEQLTEIDELATEMSTKVNEMAA